MIFEVKGSKKIANLFGNWQETMIWSCIQGVMGHLYADSQENPKSAMAILSDFCFFAGEPNRELIEYKPKWCKNNFIIMTANSSEWLELIKDVYQSRAKRVIRYAIRKEPDVFDREKLLAFAASVEPDYNLHMIDREIFEYCKMQSWSCDFVSSYGSYEEYERIGLGVVALKNGEPVSGASSYSSYQGGIEIEVDTKTEYRRQGLAAACAAGLILECLERGLYPSWDAQNLWSVALAEKLGYHFEHEYTAYEISNY